MKPVGRLVLLSLVLLALVPASAVAANPSFSFLDSEPLFPAAELVGPANHYPAPITVAGLAGTVRKVTLTAIELSASDDLDMALVGPNGAQVMLMSDACAAKSAENEIWTFEDEAAGFVPSGSCTKNERISFRPVNYEVGSDDFGAGGPTGEFSTHLSSFDGISPDGAWNLFMIDDSPGEVGFEVRSVVLNLEVEQPAPTAPIIQTVTVPGPVVTVPAVPKSTKTGKRAAALAKCKAKKTKAKRAACKAKALKLPV